MPADPHRQEGTQRRGFLSLSNDDPRKIVAVALTLCLTCSVLVASAAVLLRPLQERNQALAIKQQIVRVAGLQGDAEQIEQLFAAHIETRIVDLATGNYDDTIDPGSFDQRAAARSPATGTALAAGSGYRPHQAARPARAGLSGARGRSHQDSNPPRLRRRTVVHDVRVPGTGR